MEVSSIAGKIIYFYGPSKSHGYVSHNQRVNMYELHMEVPTIYKAYIRPM